MSVMCSMVGRGEREEYYPPSHPGTHGGHTIPWYVGQHASLGSPSIAHGCTG